VDGVTRLTVIEGGQTGTLIPEEAVAPERPTTGLLEDLYRRHAPSVYGRCRYLLRDVEEARDATQEVFARVLRALPQFRAASSPTTWLMQIATNHCLNLLRAGRAAWREEIRRAAHLGGDSPVQPDRRELVRALLRAAPDEAQEVAVLYYVDELTQAEIAEATGRSLPTVRKRLREFLAAARAALVEAAPGLTLPEGEEP
jgi:RNA polymerase sigma factor (sigma-70 family)